MTIDAQSENHSSSSSMPNQLLVDNLGLVGTIPQGLFKLPSLTELNLEVNSLTGTLPSAVCGEGSMFELFHVRRNALVGPATGVESCKNLVNLDLSVGAR